VAETIYTIKWPWSETETEVSQLVAVTRTGKDYIDASVDQRGN